MNSPFLRLTVYYVLLVSCFAALLFFPFSNTRELSFIDTFLVSCSAISGTGLTSIDVSKDLTTLGQTILLIEIQLGGIGIMVFITYLILLFGKKISLPNMILVSFDQNQKTLYSIRKIILYVLSVSVTIELIGAIATYFSIRETVRDVPRLIFISIFHSISSFANAGFDLFGTSLSSFNQNTPFLFITGLLIIAGAIGYPIYIELLHFRKKKSLYFKVNLYVHSLLIVIGTALFSLIEWKNDLFDGFSFTDKLTNLWFLSVSPRNAGYFSFDLNDLSEASLLIVMILMFIGGSSSSTSGGIRTSTLAVLFAKCKAIIKGQEPNLFKRSISKENVDRSILIFFVFFCLFFVPTIAIMVVEKMKFMPAGFEVMSAVTTTGLSLGITASLTVFSKIILSLLMLLGRIGFITFIYVWTKEEKSKMRYTKEDLIVG